MEYSKEIDSIMEEELVSEFLKHNEKWRENHALIVKAYIELTKKEGSVLPMAADVAALTGLTKQTVRTHLDALQAKMMAKDLLIFYESIALKTAHLAKAGSIQHARLYFEIMNKYLDAEEQQDKEAYKFTDENGNEQTI